MGYGILSLGTYVPPMRLKRSVIYDALKWAVPGLKGLSGGERSVGSWDEDSVTMGLEAARDCLRNSDRSINSISLASTTFPFADRSNSGIISDALNLPAEIGNEDLFGSRRAASSALSRFFRSKSEGLLVASDARDTKPGSTQEMLYGHGAAAVHLGEGDTIADIIAAASVHEDLVDQYRSSGVDFDYSLEERWVREEGWLKIVPQAVNSALREANLEVTDLEGLLVHGSVGASRALARCLKISPEKLFDNLQGSVGDCGVPQVLLMLSHGLSKIGEGECFALIGFGQGADVVIFRKNKEPKQPLAISSQLKNRRIIDNYNLFLSLRNQLSIDFGLRSERDNRTALSAFYRRRKEITGMVGGRCSVCGTLQYPRSILCVKCGTDKPQVEESLSDRIGTIKSFTEDWLAYTPFPPYIYGNVEFEGGANIMVEFADFEPGSLKVGDKTRMVFRIKDFDDKRKFRRYFWKPSPIGDEKIIS